MANSKRRLWRSLGAYDESNSIDDDEAERDRAAPASNVANLSGDSSPLIMGIYGPACRFEPSCSEYAHQAIATYGVMRGGAMAARRLARCHPLGGHGYDPVPRAQTGSE